MWEYTDAVREHFLNPKNVGEIKDADGVGEVGSLACGDALKLYLKIDGQRRITDAKFQTFGCASAIASSSALTELIKGKTVDEALKITNKEIADYLGGLPKEKMHCSVMGQEALEAAVANWRGEPVQKSGALVCKCYGVTGEQILRAIRENRLTTVEEVTNYTKAGGACGQCKEDIRRLIDEELGKAPVGEMPAAGEPKKLTNIQRMQKIMQVLEQRIRPGLQQDGGDVELVDIDGPLVHVALRGMCAGCPASMATIESFIQQTLREQVDPEIIVKEAQS
jgi:NifU-like protein